MIIGIDCGLTGAIALLDGDICRGVWDMPTTERTVGKGKEISAALLADIVQECVDASDDGLTAWIEAVSARPGQGVTSMFAFGCAVGVVRGVVGTLGVKAYQVSPNVWKRSAGLTGREKDASRTMAIEQYPEIAQELRRKKDVGRADAVLIGAYGVRHG